jgi:hypothetical protein
VRVYGVDLGTRRIAVACPDIGLVWSVDLATGTGSTANKRRWPGEFDAGMELGRRVGNYLIDWENGEYDFTGESLFVAERPFLRRARPNVKTLTGMALSAGGAMSQMPGRVVFLEPSLWKKALLDNGNASKDDVRAYVEQCHPALAEACGGDENRYDAVGIAFGGAALARASRL